MNELLKQNLSRHSVINDHSKESNAFVKSTITLRETKHIRGIEIKLNSITGNIKMCQLADDTTLFQKTKHEITIAMNIIEEFGNQDIQS
jgi:hypothetical protein